MLTANSSLRVTTVVRRRALPSWVIRLEQSWLETCRCCPAACHHQPECWEACALVTLRGRILLCLQIGLSDTFRTNNAPIFLQIYISPTHVPDSSYRLPLCNPLAIYSVCNVQGHEVMGKRRLDAKYFTVEVQLAVQCPPDVGRLPESVLWIILQTKGHILVPAEISF